MIERLLTPGSLPDLAIFRFVSGKDTLRFFCIGESVPFSCPKLGEDQKNKRSSLKFSTHFGPKLGEDQKKRSSPTICVLKPCAQVTKGGSCRNFAYYFMLKILSGLPKRGGHCPMAPSPPNTLLGQAVYPFWWPSLTKDLQAEPKKGWPAIV